MSNEKKPKKSYWYFITTYQCVLCGSTEVYRERRYTPKPSNPPERRSYNDKACHCHFF